MDKLYDMLIVGGGPGGCAAALYAARGGLTAAVLEQLSAGGQMALTEQIDNYPGFPEGVDGFTLGERMQQGAERFGAEFVLTTVEGLDLSGPEKRVHTTDGTFRGRTLVYAAGAEPRELGVPGEQTLTGRGVHYCAACDGMLYRNKTVVVAGGGNTAMADALLLSRVAKKVYVVHRRDTFRAEKSASAPVLAAENVQVLWNTTVTAALGDGELTGVRLKDVRTGQERELPCDGLFVSIGRRPMTAMVAGQLALDPSGYILADETTRTDIPGVYAVGDVRAKALRQIVTAAADGAVAAHFAVEYVGNL